MPDERIGLIGVGLLGSALAERLIKAGFSVFGFDVDVARCEELTSLGGTLGQSPADVATMCRRILLSLPNSDVVAEVVDEMVPELRPGCLIIDTTTGEPSATGELGARLAESHIDYVDATIAGSSEQARRRDVIVMVGGHAESFADNSDLFSTFARETFHVGAWGSGARMKLVVNLVLGLSRAILAEGLSFARASGLDPTETLRILKASPAYSRAMDTKGEKMLAGDFAPQARLAQHLKDVRLILQHGKDAEVHLPLSVQHAQLLESLIAQGHGELDNSAVILAYDGAHGTGTEDDQSPSC